MYICDFSRSDGAGSAITRNTRGLTRSVIALIVPPFPAASRPSKTTTTRRPFALIHSWTAHSSTWSLRSSASYSLRFMGSSAVLTASPPRHGACGAPRGWRARSTVVDPPRAALLGELSAHQVGVPDLPLPAFLMEDRDGVDDVVLEAFRPGRRDLHLHARQRELVVVADVLEGHLLGLGIEPTEGRGELRLRLVVARGLRVRVAHRRADVLVVERRDLLLRDLLGRAGGVVVGAGGRGRDHREHRRGGSERTGHHGGDSSSVVGEISSRRCGRGCAGSC